MKMLIDDPETGSDGAGLPDAVRQALDERAALVVEVMAHCAGAWVADVNDRHLSDLFVGGRLPNLLGDGVAQQITRWAISDTPGDRLDLVLPPPEGEKGRPIHLCAIRDNVGSEGRVYVVMKTAPEERSAGEATAAQEGVTNYAAEVANLTHELRSLLGGMTGLISHLSGRALTEADREYIDLLQEAGGAMTTLLYDGLRRARDVQGVGGRTATSPVLASEPFSMEDFIRSLAMTWVVTAAQAGLTMSVATDDLAGVQVRGDPLRLRQILTNILGNAVKFSEPGGSILFAVTRSEAVGEAAVYLFEIADRGPGFDPEVKKRLFERGVHAAGSGGAGLGLNISQHLATAMGGGIRADDTPGGGARLTVVIPMVEINPPIAPEQGDPRRILQFGSN